MEALAKEMITPRDGVYVVAGTIIADDIPIDFELELSDLVDLEATVELDAPPPPPLRRR